MKVRFTVVWTEEISDEAIKDWAESEGLLNHEDEVETDLDDLKTQWLESKCDEYAQEPDKIPDTMNIDYDVIYSKE